MDEVRKSILKKQGQNVASRYSEAARFRSSFPFPSGKSPTLFFVDADAEGLSTVEKGTYCQANNNTKSSSVMVVITIIIRRKIIIVVIEADAWRTTR